ncbi:MAG TPA: hypothetical protein DIT25_01735 [Candidatus Moranbacteria bacterium]|nr:hypothetical protein [Candidatus Moranbacteria bacterium]
MSREARGLFRVKNKNKKVNLFLFGVLLLAGFFGFVQKTSAAVTIIEWNFPDGSADAIADGGTMTNLTKSIITEGTSLINYSLSGTTANSAWTNNWNNGDGKKYWQIEFDSQEYAGLHLSSKQRSSNTGPKDFKLQYKIGTDGIWANIDESDITLANDFTSGILDNLALPADCDNKASVYLRWIMNSNLAVNNSAVTSIGTSNIKGIVVIGTPISIDNFEDENDDTGSDDNVGESGDKADVDEVDEIMECAKNSENIRLNEIYPYPGSGDEFVEIKNFGEECADISGWKIIDEGNHKYEFPPNTIVYSDEILAIHKNFYLNNTGTETVYLFAKASDISEKNKAVDKTSYSNAKKNFSWSLINEEWLWTSIVTPGEENEFVSEEYAEDSESDEEDPTESEYAIRLNEILPNPKGDESTGEYVEIYNGENFEIDLSGWILGDASTIKNKTLSKKGYIFPEGTVLKSGDYLVLYRPVFVFSMNNSGKETIYLLDPDGNTASSVSYDGAKEGVSFNFDGKTWRWSKFLTPGKKNKFNSLPKIEIKKIKDAYAGIPVEFSAKVKDDDKDKLKYVWDFGDEKKSYLKDVRHTYADPGKYKVSFSADDGSEKINEEFKLEVKKYPKHAVEILRLLPNPAGADTGAEWIEIKNNEKKKINLKGWKIATGPEKLINHTIFDDFFLDPLQIRRLTRENAFFSLNNKAMKLELRYPNVKTADALSYSKEKIADDEMYAKINGRWIWIKPQIKPAVNEAEDQDENDLPVPEIQETAFIIDPAEIQADLGKYSAFTRQNKMSDKIFLANLSPKNNSNLSEGKVLGASTMRPIEEIDNYYLFTPHSPEKHWAMKFWENISDILNSSINTLLLKF